MFNSVVEWDYSAPASAPGLLGRQSESNHAQAARWQLAFQTRSRGTQCRRERGTARFVPRTSFPDRGTKPEQRQDNRSFTPPFSGWASKQDAVTAHSPQFMVLTSNSAVIGTLGAQKSWGPGLEFDSDVFATVPARDGKHYLAAVLLANPGQLEHAHEVITLEMGQSCGYELHVDSGPGSRNDALRETYRVR
jgi:hypothetical protein